MAKKGNNRYDLSTETFILTSEQVQDIASIGVELLPAPGVGKAIVASELSNIKYVRGNTYYNGYPELRLTTNGFNQAQLTQDTLIPSDKSGWSKFFPYSPVYDPIVQINENAGLSIVGDIDSSQGNGSVIVTVVYSIITTV